MAEFELAIVPQFGGQFDSLPEKKYLSQLGGYFYDAENKEDNYTQILGRSGFGGLSLQRE